MKVKVIITTEDGEVLDDVILLPFRTNPETVEEFSNEIMELLTNRFEYEEN